MRITKIAAVATHPIQYFAPLYAELASRPGIELHVFFATSFGLRPYLDSSFGKTISWDIPMIRGYSHTFLKQIWPLRPEKSDSTRVFTDLPKHLKAFDPEYILVGGWGSAIDRQALTYGLIRGVKILLRPEVNDDPIVENSAKMRLKRILLKFLYMKIYRFLYIGKRARAHFDLHCSLQNKAVFSPYCVDNARFQKDDRNCHRSEIRSRLKIPDKRIVFLFVGKLIDSKDPARILYALNHLPGNMIASVVYVGDGPLRPALEANATNHSHHQVVFAGFKNQSELAEYYAMSDVLVLPSISYKETWGLVVNEAMNFGLPVIACDRAGCVDDLIIPGRTGFTFSSRDHVKLASLMSEFIGSPELVKLMGQEARSHISGYSVNLAVDGILRDLQ